MTSPSDGFLADWSAEEALVWIVTRQLHDVLTPGFWQGFKNQNPAGATAAEADFLELLRLGDVMSRERQNDLDRVKPTWRERDIATEMDRWPDCYAHAIERFAPIELMEFFPSDCRATPISDGGRVTVIELANWIACRLSVSTKRSAQPHGRIDDLLLASSRQNTGLGLWGWRDQTLTGDPERISPDVVSALVHGDCTLMMSPGNPGYGKFDGCAFVSAKGFLWSGLHYLETDTRLISEGYDFSCSFREFVCSGNLDLQKGPTDVLGTGYAAATDTIVEQGRIKRHKGAPYLDDKVKTNIELQQHLCYMNSHNQSNLR